eukprot:TRINITY_DN5014_c0_g1_i2.p1 TRINITY_DN5014_c0_g1~~TRINITY_DN5014_c0_g1_i2.p1  ORF type:complete len:168 (-),score=21.31 TRINITY_DN5014_c0_g1_i2:755-1258(-)
MRCRYLAACAPLACVVRGFLVPPSHYQSRAGQHARICMSCEQQPSAGLPKALCSTAAAIAIAATSVLDIASPPAALAAPLSSFNSHMMVVASAEADMDGALAELSRAKDADQTLTAMVKVNEILDSDDGTMENPLAREVREIQIACFGRAVEWHASSICIRRLPVAS